MKMLQKVSLPALAQGIRQALRVSLGWSQQEITRQPQAGMYGRMRCPDPLPAQAPPYRGVNEVIRFRPFFFDS